MTTKLTITLAALGLLTLSACESTGGPGPSIGPRPSVAANFDRRDFAWSEARGRGRIDGQLTMRRGATTYSCEVANVVAIPETPWVRERMQRLYRSADRAVIPAEEVRQRMPAESPNYDAFVRRANCDAQGRFTFTGLPDGAWYLITSVAPTPAGAPLAVMRRVQIRGGQPVRVEL